MNELKQLIQLRKNLLFLQMEYAVYLFLYEQNDFAEAISKTEACYFCIGLEQTDDNLNAWNELLSKAQSCFEYEGPKCFIEKSWQDVWSTPVKSKAPVDLENEKAIIAKSFEGFTYEYHGEYFKDPKPQLLTLHFRNAFWPDSPFRHLQELSNGLKRIVNEVRQQRPDVLRVQCASWLNNVPAFTGLFPESWLKGSKVVSIEGNSGWWGQFIDREGKFQHKRADEFRKAWKFYWPNRMCTCDLSELMDFLA